MRNFILLICLLISFSSVFSQFNSDKLTDPAFYSKESEKKVLSIDDIEGSPYKYEKFCSGEVYFIMNKKPMNYKLNYNVYKDSIEYIKNGKKYSVTNPQDIDKIFINNDVLLYLNYYNKSSITTGYFIEIINNYVSLYKKESIILVLPNQEQNLIHNKPAKFQRLNPRYYISISGNPASLIKNKKSFIDLFVNKAVIKDYIKKEKINLNSEKDLIKLVDFLNTY